jgi:hypothetical protein
MKLQLHKIGVLHELHTSKDICLDFDRRRTPKLRYVWTALRLCELVPTYIEHRRTHRGWHTRIRLRESLEPAEIVCLQAILGSDTKRETFNLIRVLWLRRNKSNSTYLNKRWNLLFDRKIDGIKLLRRKKWTSSKKKTQH